MKGKLVLNLGRVDFVAAAIEHVFFAVMDGDVALGVHAAQIAGFPPAIGEVEGVGLWIVPVAGDDVGAFFPDFAALPDGQFLALLVADGDFAAMERVADAGGMGCGFFRRECGEGAGGLGGAVSVHEAKLGRAIGEVFDCGLKHGGAAKAADAPACFVGAVECWGEQHEGVDGRWAHGVGDGVALDFGQRVGGFEGAHQHDGARDCEGAGDAGDEAGDVAGGGGEEHAALSVDGVGSGELQRGVDDREMGEAGAFGPTCCAGGVEEDSGVVLIGCGRGDRLAQQGFERERIGGVPVGCDAVFDGGDVGGFGDVGGEICVKDDGGGAALIECEGHFGGALQGVDGDADEAGGKAGGEGFHEGEAVAHQERDAVAFGEAQFFQAPGDLHGAGLQGGVGEGALDADQSGGVWMRVGGAREHVVKGRGALSEAGDFAAVMGLGAGYELGLTGVPHGFDIELGVGCASR